MARVFSQKHSSIFVGNVGINSVGTKSVYQNWQSDKKKMSRRCLAGRLYAWDTHKTQLSPSCPDSSHSSMCKSHGSLCGMLSRNSLMKTLQSLIAWVFTHTLSITQPLQLNPTINTGYKRLNKITIKFGMELKLTKHIVVNYNFTWSIQ